MRRDSLVVFLPHYWSVSVGVSTVFELMTSQKLTKLGSAVQTLEGQQKLLIQQVEQDSIDIASNNGNKNPS